MSKGNMFLGHARGKVGDVVFYRQSGEQITRTRNRHPRNPKTDAQQLQRAISATIVQAYKAGSIIFDHAFEGKSKGSECQRRFLSVNMRQLRAAVISEMTTAAEDAYAAVVSPRATYPVPNAYRISEGSLVQNLFELSIADGQQFEGPIATMVAANTGETVAQYAARLGLLPGEIYTICCFGVGSTPTSADLVSPVCEFGFVRLIVKDSVTSSSVAMTAATYGDFFTIDESGTTFPDTQLVTLGLNLDQVIPGTNNYRGSMGVIRSRENSGLRSTTDMLTIKGIEQLGENKWGVKPINLLTAWDEESGSVQSELILEGGGF